MTLHRNARVGVRLVALLGATLLLPACATITRGSSQDFTVESTPSGARVSTSNGFQCESTPCTFRMPRKNGFRVTVSREGYASQEVTVTSGVSGGGAAGMAGNVVFGGVIGAVVDGTSGAMNDLSPNPLVVVLLTPEQQRAADAEARRAAATAAATAAASE
jgi:hypothetical protein